MTEYRGVIAGTGNAGTGINEISGGLTARYLYNILGYSSGVLKNALNEFDMTYTNLTFSVAGGQAVAYGYIGEITTTSEFTFTAPSANSKYYFVYLDFDLRETIKKFAVSYYDNSNSDVWSPRQDNLANNDVGRFQLPIYKIKIDSDNTITVTDLREIKQIVKDATKINGIELKKDENGVLKIGDIIIPQRKTISTTPISLPFTIPNIDILTFDSSIGAGDTIEIEWTDSVWKGKNKYTFVLTDSEFNLVSFVQTSSAMSSDNYITGVAFYLYYSSSTNTLQYRNEGYFEIGVNRSSKSISYVAPTSQSASHTFTITKITKIIE